MKLFYFVVFSLVCFVVNLNGAKIKHKSNLNEKLPIDIIVKPIDPIDPIDIIDPDIEPNNNIHYCYSQNDPHMKNFNNQYFEFQFVGSFCMYSSRYFKVEAQFEKCDPASTGTGPTCNCRVRVTHVISGKYIEVNTCGASGGAINKYKTGPPASGSITFPVILTTANTYFKVGTGPSHYKIKTNILGGNDIEVRVYPGWVNMNRIEIDASTKYLATGQQNYDRCLCGYQINYPGGGRGINVKRMSEKCPIISVDDITEKCKTILLADSRSKFQSDLDLQGKQEIDELIQNCVLDFLAILEENDCNADKIEIGLFQKNVVDEKIFETEVRKSSSVGSSGDDLSQICKLLGKQYVQASKSMDSLSVPRCV